MLYVSPHNIFNVDFHSETAVKNEQLHSLSSYSGEDECKYSDLVSLKNML